MAIGQLTMQQLRTSRPTAHFDFATAHSYQLGLHLKICPESRYRRHLGKERQTHRKRPDAKNKRARERERERERYRDVIKNKGEEFRWKGKGIRMEIERVTRGNRGIQRKRMRVEFKKKQRKIVKGF